MEKWAEWPSPFVFLVATALTMITIKTASMPGEQGRGVSRH